MKREHVSGVKHVSLWSLFWTFLKVGSSAFGGFMALISVVQNLVVERRKLLRHEDMLERESRHTYPCIKCGECVESCPMGLNPSTLGMLAAKREYDLMGSGYHLGDCFECGCCTYVCPSNIPLVQQFRVAKQILREKAVA